MLHLTSEVPAYQRGPLHHRVVSVVRRMRKDPLTNLLGVWGG